MKESEVSPGPEQAPEVARLEEFKKSPGYAYMLAQGELAIARNREDMRRFGLEIGPEAL